MGWVWAEAAGTTEEGVVSLNAHLYMGKDSDLE